jgi:glucose-1-phosphate thymidylyltransferase
LEKTSREEFEESRLINRNQLYFNRSNEKVYREVIGLIPAAGEAKRIAPLPCSKELFPVGFEIEKESKLQRPKSACEYLIERMENAGVSKTYIIIRKGKWDIPSYLGDGSQFGMHFAYLMMRIPFGVPYTLDQAYPFIKDKNVVLGFPDIIYECNKDFQILLKKINSRNCDIVLGLFFSDMPEKADLVAFDNKRRVKKIVKKNQTTHLRYTWGIAAWTPVFTNYLHNKLREIDISAFIEKELFISDIVNFAVQDGLQVEAIQVSDKPFIDIGTPEGLARSRGRFMSFSKR